MIHLKSDKILCAKIREFVTGGPSIVFTRKALVDVISSKKCESMIGIDPCHFSQCIKICLQDCTRDGSLTPICRN